MKVGLLGYNFSEHGRSRILAEIKKLATPVEINVDKVCLFAGKSIDVQYNGTNLDDIDAVISRTSTHNFRFGITVAQHFSRMGVPVINSSESIEVCQNKYLTALALQRKKIPQPRSAIARSAKELLKHVSTMEMPVIFKLLYAGDGCGVAKINTGNEASDWLRTFGRIHRDLYIQEYIRHVEPEDYRIFVIGDKIAGAMKRIAKKGQWKTNFSLGNDVKSFNPNQEIRKLAFKSAKAVGADICGVDIMKGLNGYQVIEVNQNPGFKGLEKATHKNIAREIVRYVIKKAKR